METKPPSPDYRLALGHGSAWHLLRCLGWQRQRFTAQIAREVGATSITWLDFPAYAGNQAYPSGSRIRDGEWKGISFLGDADADVREAYAQFWPGRGEQQNWDLVGRAVINEKVEWLLLEAKAHTAEIKAGGTDAKEVGGRPMIRAAFTETLAALGYDADHATALAEKWLTGFYQQANRLATLHFLNKQRIPARLIFLYFCGDQHPDGKDCPVNAEAWTAIVKKIHNDLGLSGDSLLEQRVHEIFVQLDQGSDLSQ